MFQFLTIGIFAILFSFISTGTGKRVRYVSIIPFILIWYIMSFQDCIGMDFSGYLYSFKAIKAGTLPPAGYLEAGSSGDVIEAGWYYLNFLFGKVFDSFYFVTAFVYFVILYSFKKLFDSINPTWQWLAILFFYLSPMLLYMSAMRQSFGIALFILSVLAIEDKKWFKAILLFFLGTTMHSSMIIAAMYYPFLLLSKIDYKKKKALTLLIFTGLYISLFVGGTFFKQSAIGAVSAMMDTSDSYMYYVQEFVDNDSIYSLSATASYVIIFIYSVVAMMNSEGFSKKILLFFIISQFMSIFFGNLGSIGSLAQYVAAFSVPAYALIPKYIKNPLFKAGFVIVAVVITVYSFLSKLTNEQFIAYLDYHTIFF